MDWFKRSLAQIQVQLSELAVSQKLLIGTLTIVIPIVLLLVWRYAASPEMVPVLPQAIDGAKRVQIAAFLDGHGIAYNEEGDRILVPVARRYEVQAALAAQQLLPQDTSEGFAQILGAQNWWQSSEQNRQAYNIALQAELARVIRAYPWVRSATVIISRPQNVGFAATHHRPSAAVNVVMASGSLDQKKVDAITGLVSGAVAEMTPQNVTVIDAAAGRQWKVRTDDQLAPGDYLENINAQETYVRDKITDALKYIRNVIVSVNVELDLTRKQTDTTRYDKDNSLELQKEQHNKTTETTDGSTGIEPGVRANAGADLTVATSAPARHSTTEDNQSTFDTYAATIREHANSPGGVPTRISATVNVPRGFFVALYRQQHPVVVNTAAAPGAAASAPADPTDDQLRPIVEDQLARIHKLIEPLIAAKDPGQVVVDVYPDADVTHPSEVGSTPVLAAGVTASSLLNSPDAARNVGLGALATLSLGLMFMMVRKAGQTATVATAQELAGVPPVLSSGDEVIGEVESAEPPLMGMELGEDEIRHRKLADQVVELVKANPAEAGALLKNWMRKHD